MLVLLTSFILLSNPIIFDNEIDDQFTLAIGIVHKQAVSNMALYSPNSNSYQYHLGRLQACNDIIFLASDINLKTLLLSDPDKKAD